MNRKLVTSQAVNVCKVFVGAQKKQILTVELVDEMDRPIVGIGYTIAHKDGVVARGKFTCIIFMKIITLILLGLISLLPERYLYLSRYALAKFVLGAVFYCDIFYCLYCFKNIQNNENTSEMTFKSLKFLLFSFLGVSSFTFAERYEIDSYIVDVKSMCAEGNVDCQNVNIKLLELNNCYYFEGKGVTVNSKKSLNFYGYAFYSDDFLYNLYTREHVALEVLRDGEVFYFGYGNIVSDIHEDLESIYIRCIGRE